MENRHLAKLEYNEQNYELPILEGTEHNQAIDISRLLLSADLTTYDPGLGNTAETKSAITYIDGNQGILRYRGYPIEQLAAKSSFLEVAYLLIAGKLPTTKELDKFTHRIAKHYQLKPEMRDFLNTFPQEAHPMAVMGAAVNALPGFYPELVSVKDDEKNITAIYLLLAKLATITSYINRRRQGLSVLPPDSNLSFVSNFMGMNFSDNSEVDHSNPELIRALDVLFLLHADHEQNCSTSTVRLVGSADANLFTSVSAGIGALSGPLHGGANQSVIEMLMRIKDNGGDPTAFMDKVKNKVDGIKLMGFGHRVYKNYDPRAAIVKKIAYRVLDIIKVEDGLFDIARGLEEIALQDDYFIQRKLYPNVDFYTGLIYRAMQFSNEMFTPLFAIGRLPGWIAHWREMRLSDTKRIGRPRQLYVGETERNLPE